MITIAAVLAVLQARDVAQTRAVVGVIEAHRAEMDQRAIHALLTGTIARAMIRPENPNSSVRALNGEQFTMMFGGRTYDARLQDVEGLVDIYLAPPVLLDAIGLDTRRILEAREEIAGETAFGRHASLSQTMAVMGIDAARAHELTQDARDPGLRPENTTEDRLRRAVPVDLLVDGNATLVQVDITPQR